LETKPLKKLILTVLATSLISVAAYANDPLLLGNDSWPPFIIDGPDKGTSEKLVCEALERSGRSCTVKVGDWDVILDEARVGAIDGIAAAWKNAYREKFLLFSEPYLTNRIVPVTRKNHSSVIESVNDLAGMRVALVTDYAYGDEISSMSSSMEIIHTRNTLEALRKVHRGEADAALVDEMVVRDVLARVVIENLSVSSTVLAFRDLHFAVSRQNPMAEAIIDDFQRTYELMLADGTVNEILDVDWLATGFGQSGKMNVVVRSGISLDDLDYPADDGSVYAMGDSEYQMMRQGKMDSSRVNYQVDGKSYSSLQTALDDVFGKDTVCKHKNFTSQFDCTDLFKKRN
jgi:polar amino acid transport system substrate-binding protein